MVKVEAAPTPSLKAMRWEVALITSETKERSQPVPF
jgi:hypothetical protein